MEKSPDAFRTISEAAEELDLPQHVLRFWETRFSTIKPLKRGGGRRYYRPEDVLLLKGIRHLLYDQGFTIKGVQKILKDQGVRHVAAIGNGGDVETLPLPAPEAGEDAGGAVETAAPAPPGDLAPRSAVALDGNARDRLSAVLKDLLECKRLLERARE
jgi:DNA-binding transcriptional MerR regulator